MEIKEISKEETEKINKDIIDFNPTKCLACENKKKIVQRFFLLDTPVNNESLHRKVNELA